MGDTEVTNSIV